MKKLICVVLVLVLVLSFAPTAFAATSFISSLNVVNSSGKVVQSNVDTFVAGQGNKLEVKFTSPTFARTIYIIKEGASRASTYATPANGSAIFTLENDIYGDPITDGNYTFYYRYALPGNGYSAIQFVTVWSGKWVTVTHTPPPKATAMKINKTAASVTEGKTIKLKATTKPATASQAMKWTSSNSKVAKVSADGLVTAVKGGTATITVATQDGSKLKATCKVTVIPLAKKVIYKKSLTLKKGQSKTITATVSPKTAKQSIKYTSSDKKIATVSSKGKIVARKKGTAKITAIAKDGSRKQAVLTLKVK